MAEKNKNVNLIINQEIAEFQKNKEIFNRRENAANTFLSPQYLNGH